MKTTNTHYIFTGTHDGRVFQYNKKNNLFIARLCSFSFIQTTSKTLIKKNAISALTSLHPLVAAAGLGGEIMVCNTLTRANTQHLLESKSTIKVLLFINKEQLLAANVDGEIYIHNLTTASSKKLVTTLHNIEHLVYIQENHTLIASAKTNYISLIDLNKQKIINNKFHTFHTIVKNIQRTPRVTLLVELQNSHTKEIKLPKNKTQMHHIKDKEIKLNIQGEKKLQQAYENNDFQLCYEIIDTYKLYPLPLAILLEKHWEKLMLVCEEFALKGEVKAILSTLDTLLFIPTRSYKIGDLLRLSFFVKIEELYSQNLFQSSSNLLYSYIDIFGYDKEIATLIKQYELLTQQKIAIFRDDTDRKSRGAWRSYFHHF